MPDLKHALSIDPTRRDVQLVFRAACYVLVGLGIAADLWDVPWRIYGMTMALALPIFLVSLWKSPRWLFLSLDALVVLSLVYYSGGARSPYVFVVYLWFFGLVLLNVRYNRRTPLVLIGAVMLALLGISGWSSVDWLDYVGFLGLHALGVGCAVLLGFNLLDERTRQQTDPLTGVLHRRAGIEKLNEWIAEKKPFSLAFVDVKGFKRINDSYGHAVGDEMVCAVAGRLAARVRKDDIVMRYGGDEFVVASDLLALCPRLEAALLSPINTSAGPIPLQIDIGEVKWTPGESLEELLVAADEAMYRKKHDQAGQKLEPKPRRSDANESETKEQRPAFE